MKFTELLPLLTVSLLPRASDALMSHGTTHRVHAPAGVTKHFPTGTHPSSQPHVGDEIRIPETAFHRMRRRKAKILHKKKLYNTSYLFALCYVFSVAYNIFSKKALKMAPSLAWTTATLQMSLGLSYVLPLWESGVRDQPTLSRMDLLRLLPVSILHALVHIGGVVSMGAGAVSFTYIVSKSYILCTPINHNFTEFSLTACSKRLHGQQRHPNLQYQRYWLPSLDQCFLFECW